VIVFDLRCASAHVFEAWFASSGAYDEQRSRGLIACPLCADTAIEKAVMAPNVSAKANTRVAGPPMDVKAALQALASAQRKALEGSRWVGKDFASQARAMHEGVQAHETIHGQATVAEAKALVAEGVPLAPLPLPIVPPEQTN
jgi:hypothetical protein